VIKDWRYDCVVADLCIILSISYELPFYLFKFFFSLNLSLVRYFSVSIWKKSTVAAHSASYASYHGVSQWSVQRSVSSARVEPGPAPTRSSTSVTRSASPPSRSEAWLFPINRSVDTLASLLVTSSIVSRWPASYASLPRSCSTKPRRWWGFPRLWIHRFRLVKWRRYRAVVSPGCRSLFTFPFSTALRYN